MPKTLGHSGIHTRPRSIEEPGCSQPRPRNRCKAASGSAGGHSLPGPSACLSKAPELLGMGGAMDAEHGAKGAELEPAREELGIGRVAGSPLKKPPMSVFQ